MSQITKRYGAAVALESADLYVARGQVMALLGENGAGKSTLMKILAGLEAPDWGQSRLTERTGSWVHRAGREPPEWAMSLKS